MSSSEKRAPRTFFRTKLHSLFFSPFFFSLCFFLSFFLSFFLLSSLKERLRKGILSKLSLEKRESDQSTKLNLNQKPPTPPQKKQPQVGRRRPRRVDPHPSPRSARRQGLPRGQAPRRQRRPLHRRPPAHQVDDEVGERKKRKKEKERRGFSFLL